MDYEHLIAEVDNGIATLTLDRPDQRNALNRQLRNELKDFIHNRLSDVQVVIITGKGPVFCAGMDLKETVGFGEGQDQWSLFRDLFNTDRIVIGALNGPAVGAGITMTCACDLVVADPSVKFALPQITHGIYGGVAIPMLHFKIPKNVVAEMTLLAHAAFRRTGSCSRPRQRDLETG